MADNAAAELRDLGVAAEEPVRLLLTDRPEADERLFDDFRGLVPIRFEDRLEKLRQFRTVPKRIAHALIELGEGRQRGRSGAAGCHRPPGLRSSLSNQTLRPAARASGAASNRRFSSRAASLSAPEWLRKMKGTVSDTAWTLKGVQPTRLRPASAGARKRGRPKFRSQAGRLDSSKSA